MHYFYTTEEGLIIHGHLLEIAKEWHLANQKDKDFLFYVLMINHNAITDQLFTRKHFQYYYRESFQRAFQFSLN